MQEVVAMTDQHVSEHSRIILERQVSPETRRIHCLSTNPVVVDRSISYDIVTIANDENVPCNLERTFQCFLSVLLLEDRIVILRPSDFEPELRSQMLVRVLNNVQNHGAKCGDPET